MTSRAEFIKGCNFIENLSSTDDLDDFRNLNQSGFYFINGCTNNPTGVTTGFMILIANASGVSLQIVITTNVGKMCMRKYGSGTWTAWTSATFT